MPFKDPKDRQKYQRANWRRWSKNHHAHRLKRLYGITVEQYDAMLQAQENVCALCRKPQMAGRRLCVDHDHSCCARKTSCGKCVRGLLCDRCNRVVVPVIEKAGLVAFDYVFNYPG